ncbi:hypothetical protein [Sulfidibacter corallicola]|uniref:Uncharacterized protein n=1 Tax=Sulfidibacter corallicola TaxID=2818388 RepID=A0A8A4TJ61_SULCO|nr:hypothetical protein [Sulfidibacter corallicola]QTD49192.1 hypothetical protein J3U87_26705 [Sulfidibacter corallicola]
MGKDSTRPVLDGYPNLGGTNERFRALRNLLSHAGVTSSQDGAPSSDALHRAMSD